MASDISKAKSQLKHIREMQGERAADFWQRTVTDGRTQRQMDMQMSRQQTPEQKPRQPRQ